MHKILNRLLLIQREESVTDENKKDVINKRNGQELKYLKFFLLVFLIWRPKPKAQSPKPKPKKPKSIP